MAVLDDKTWLLAFIRNQFIISDDTSICENLLGPDLEPEESDTFSSNFLGLPSQPGREDGGSQTVENRDRPLSPDIFLESDSRVTRRRSNTAVRLEKIRKERDDKGRVQTTRWKSRIGVPARRFQSQQSLDDLDVAFAQVELAPKQSAHRSLLSMELEKTEDICSKQVFEEFAKFDGRMHGFSKNFMVYIHLPDTPGESVPALNVCVVENARFLDLVGLVCLKWTQSKSLPELKHIHISNYSLMFAEDNGDIDRDIPAIDLSETVGKFGAASLAFVENEETTPIGASVPVVVKVNLVEGSFSKFVFDSADIPLSLVLDKVLKKRNMNPKVRGLEYTLEKAGLPGVPLDLTQTLDSVRTREFWMVRVNSKNPSVFANFSGIGGII